LAVALGEAAGCTVDTGEHFVDACGREFWVDACPSGVEKGGGHVLARRVAEAFVEPQHFADEGLVQYAVFGGVGVGGERWVLLRELV